MWKQIWRESKWRYWDNSGPWARHWLRGERARGEGARVLAELNRLGVARTSVERLLGRTEEWEALRAQVERAGQARAAEMAEARQWAGVPGEKKSFLFELPDQSGLYDGFALLGPIVHVVNGYLGMEAKLAYANVWHSFTTEAPPQRSQLWHRDQDDYLEVKIFAYLRAVEDGAGPFTYAPGTHPKGRVRAEPESFREPGHGNRRSTDEQMARVVPPELWVRATGPAGTLLFADTRGYHKGGYARTQERLVFTAMYTSPKE
jgi:hypothetical protein